MRRHAVLLTACLAMGVLAAMPAPAREIAIDDARSQARFQLRLALGRALDGRFPRLTAHWLAQPDGRWRVAVALPADAAEIPGHPRYTRIMRSQMFFDSRRHPEIHFLSDPFDPSLLARGGALAGVLTMRGSGRRESLQLAPSVCRPPVPRDCVLEVDGKVGRSAYGMTALKGVVGDEVAFRLRIAHGAAP